MKTDTLNPTAAVTVDWQASPTRRALEGFFRTPFDTTGLILRLGLALAMFPHGAQKALGWFGGWGFSNTVAGFGQMGYPTFLTLLIIAAEFLGPLALAAGFFTRFSAAGIGIVMAGAALIMHAQHGFFMNWAGTQKGEGLEYFVLAVALSLALVVHGAGRWAADGWIARKLAESRGGY